MWCWHAQTPDAALPPAGSALLSSHIICHSTSTMSNRATVLLADTARMSSLIVQRKVSVFDRCIVACPCTLHFFFFVKYVFRCGLIFAVNISEICETEKLWFSSSLCGIFCVVWECEPVCSLVTFWENAVKKIWKLHHSEPSTFNLKVFQLNVNLTKHMVWH